MFDFVLGWFGGIVWASDVYPGDYIGWIDISGNKHLYTEG